MFRRLLACVVMLIFLVGSALSDTTKSKVKITNIYPGLLQTKSYGTLLISGKNLEIVKNGELRPVNTADATLPNPSVSIKPIDSTQLIVEANLSSVSVAGTYLLYLETAKNEIQVVVPINVQGAGQPIASANEPVSATQGPFAACLNNSSSMLSSTASQVDTGVNCSSSVLTDHEVLDNFGQHVSHVYYAIQVRVSNQNSQYDFLLRDILITLPDGRVISGRIKRLAQGVALKGRSEDHRAIAYNVIQAVGTTYGSAVVFPVSSTLKNIGNLFQGPLEAAFTQIAPDYTADNINRFNNAVFDDQSPSVVPKGGTSQPPLYVIALVPKPTGDYPYKTSFIDLLSVGIEGTFIQQVNTVSMSPASLSFKPEFISPPSYDTALGSDVSLADLQAASAGQTITLSNQSSSAVTVSKITISSSSGGASSADFQVEADQAKCGTQTIDPTKSFSIPAQQTCQFLVRSTPQEPGDTTATLTIEGANIDSTQKVSLTGSGVGFYLDTATVGASKEPFKCSLIAGSCTVDLGFIDLSKKPLPFSGYVFSTKATDSCPAITLTSTIATAAPTVSTAACKVLVLPMMKNPTPSTQLGFTFDPKLSSIPVTLKIGDSSESINFKYQTINTTTTLSPPTAGAPNNVTAQVQGTDKSFPPANSTVKLLIQQQGSTSLTTQEATTNSTGQAKFTLSTGTYILNAVFEANGMYAQSPPSNTVTISIAATPTAAK